MVYKMKKKWEEPKILVQEFMPNEYVAACWGVACSVDAANKVDKNSDGVTHQRNHCGLTSNQFLVDADNNGTPEAMQEILTDGLGTLNCIVYDSEDYKNRRLISTVKTGDYIYWTTSAGNRTWHHQGEVTATVPGHPNRS